MAPSAVSFSFPPSILLQVPPTNNPPPLRPPSFLFTPAIYDAVLDFRVPTTIVCIYIAGVIASNKYNESRRYKPWAISTTMWFFYSVVAHNVVLAMYSAWNFVGTFNTLGRGIRISSETGVVGLVDRLCKIHGAPGLGNAMIYRPEFSTWTTQASNETVNLPSPTDSGRLWNEGLAFYGWLFYMSKFYELLDTLIILAKGKSSSALQSYHHTGVIMVMWSNMRYMVSPFWIGMLMNSAIHALMVN